MGIIQFPTPIPSTVGTLPNLKFMITTDNLATVTTAGYLNSANSQSTTPIDKSDIIMSLYSYNQQTGAGTFAIFTVTIAGANGSITLSNWANPGDVVLPVVDNDFANFSGTTGTIKDSGYSPTDATKTKVVMLNAAPTINHVAIFTNANGTIGDGGVLGTAAAKAASDNTKATLASITAATTSGRLAQFNDTSGTIGDSTLTAATVQLSTNLKAARTANIGGGGAGPLSVVVAGLTAASIINANINTSSNTVAVAKVTATATGFDILFSADPGATCLVDYQAFVAAQ